MPLCHTKIYGLKYLYVIYTQTVRRKKINTAFGLNEAPKPE
jgi:hypothetical protein